MMDRQGGREGGHVCVEEGVRLQEKGGRWMSMDQ